MQYGFTKICLITLLVVFCISAGCTVKYIDTVTIFEIKGEVYDKETSLPIENVAVQFRDTGYDYVRSNRPFLITIGQSETDGKFIARLNYLWRSKDAILDNPPRKTFDIVLSHEYYEPWRFHFDESKLQHDGMRFVINFDKIYMQPKNEEKNSRFFMKNRWHRNG